MIAPNYEPFDSTANFVPMDDTSALSEIELRLYSDLRDAATSCAAAEAESKADTEALHASVRDLRDAEHQRDLLPKITQQDLLKAVLAANRR